MNRTIGWIIIGLIFFISSSNNEPDLIYWSEDYRLSWDDFQGQPRFDQKYISALTSSGIVDYKGCKDGMLIYEVKAYFERQNSWVKQEAYTDYHLAHEQLHFDITELNARRLRRALTKRQFLCGQEEEFSQFVQANLQEWFDDQRDYDFATRHSMDKVKQKEWMYRIHTELSLLDDYKE